MVGFRCGGWVRVQFRVKVKVGAGTGGAVPEADEWHTVHALRLEDGVLVSCVDDKRMK